MSNIGLFTSKDHKFSQQLLKSIMLEPKSGIRFRKTLVTLSSFYKTSNLTLIFRNLIFSILSIIFQVFWKSGVVVPFRQLLFLCSQLTWCSRGLFFQILPPLAEEHCIQCFASVLLPSYHQSSKLPWVTKMKIMHFQCCYLKQEVAILLVMPKDGSCREKKREAETP